MSKQVMQEIADQVWESDEIVEFIRKRGADLVRESLDGVPHEGWLDLITLHNRLVDAERVARTQGRRGIAMTGADREWNKETA
jgi:hypothetical protein